MDNAQLDLASKYLQAADTYRDQLQPDEQATLDAYLKELAKAKAVAGLGVLRLRGGTGGMQPAHRRSRRPRRAQPAGVTSRSPAAANQAPAERRHQAARPVAAPRSARAAPPGQLRHGPAKGRRGRGAGHQVGAVRRHARQGRPRKSRRRGPAVVAPAVDAAANQPHDRRTARTKLHEARTALTNRQFEQAEAIALEVKDWGLTYGFFEDNPDKVAAAARALRRRDKIRNTPPREQSSQGVYDILVQESRAAHVGRQARRGGGEGTAGSADERRSPVDGGSGRVGPP